MIDFGPAGLILNGTLPWSALIAFAVLLTALAACVFMLRRERYALRPKLRSDWRKLSLNTYFVVLVPVWFTLLFAVGLTTWRMFTNPPDASDALALRIHYLALVGFLGVLGGIFSLPLSLMRAEANERQTKAAESQVDTALAQVDVAQQGQVTDRINKAVEGLGAEKTVSRIGRPVTFEDFDPDSFGEGTEDQMRRELRPAKRTVIEWQNEDLVTAQGETASERGDWQAFNETLPNLEVRIGAIYALERIAQDSDRDHIRIMEILCAYIRENAPASMAKPFPEEWQKLFAEGWEKSGGRWPSFRDIWRWPQTLGKPRTDIRVALKVIGRRTPKQIDLERAAEVPGSEVGYRLDLRETCLQGADMAELNFDHAILQDARLQGARLRKANLQGVRLDGAQLQGAHLGGAQLQGRTLTGRTCRGLILAKRSCRRRNLAG
ncbi:pentapeptide repeat-containing protein [Aestuariicoccus sp. MJ-SS9]|uniref:pentapeptide repeat-containing protein n=1 Tax=Aestuariicoccus sp. MJ-SS9 TaxID=3079855 RepID=UPI002913E535|nr:pentapeptide repeat-containing protein [Aestuariicoccus sp. MJ-SS9]MDU8911110.1 pentapeptide repeat-containing protein [Aestuariicoccus sp. MJ-SS9]